MRLGGETQFKFNACLGGGICLMRLALVVKYASARLVLLCCLRERLNSRLAFVSRKTAAQDALF
ncbi:hypothetical protein [uncultured Campylobacter sp.]|uniref:hypothetical protein n=1 Tax=uncultured Campylobacter sp. TaxID=218934 RepID=UPI0026281631|nr:hypothetical protein [uncultured Campylobacter sp.]